MVYIRGYIEGMIIPRLQEIVYSPLSHTNMFWTVIPLIGAIILMELYYAHHKAEELGWNTAFGNTIALFFVTAALLRHFFSRYEFVDLLLDSDPFYKFVLIMLIAAQALVLMYFNYFHTIPEWLSFMVSSTLSTTGLALVAVVLIFSGVSFDWATFWSVLILITGLWAILKVIHVVFPTASEDKIRLKVKETFFGGKKEHLNHVKKVKGKK